MLTVVLWGRVTEVPLRRPDLAPTTLWSVVGRYRAAGGARSNRGCSYRDDSVWFPVREVAMQLTAEYVVAKTGEQSSNRDVTLSQCRREYFIWNWRERRDRSALRVSRSGQKLRFEEVVEEQRTQMLMDGKSRSAGSRSGAFHSNWSRFRSDRHGASENLRVDN